jgi:hypothetical protein
MRYGTFGLIVAMSIPVLLAVSNCGNSAGKFEGSGDGGLVINSDGGSIVLLPDGNTVYTDGAPVYPTTADAGFTAPDCPGCTFPGPGAPACASSAPAITIAYPADGVLLPPNMNVISVQWTPFGSAYKEFEVDFANAVTNVRVVTKCATQTQDTEQPPQPSGGCELLLDPTMWATIANTNRGGDPVAVTVRGTTDGMCATSSTGTVKISFGQEDLLGAIYYWKSTVSANGVGGQIWEKDFGNTTAAEVEVSGPALPATCNGCHALSRDGTRMVVYSDDDDSDDEYGDVSGKLLDMTKAPPVLVTGGTAKNSGQPPGFSTIGPLATNYLTSNGLPNLIQAPANALTLWNGQTGAFVSAVPLGAAGTRPTMPDWSADGTTVLYVLPSANAHWDGNTRNDDAHIFGGSLYTVANTGPGMFGSPSVFLQSSGENNYYPSFSPDGQLVVFDRVAQDTSVPSVDACTGTPPHMVCPNDSFSNPAARMMVVPNKAASTPIDLEAANGSPAASPVPLSNSWPKWSPFVQYYRRDKVLWIAFSSTRDYGLRVRNHQQGMFQCYPADSAEDPNGAHKQPFDPACQQPQLWMAAIDITRAVAPQVVHAAASSDPSKVAFWLPFQDITTHNHTPQWTQAVASTPPPDAGTCIPANGDCTKDPSGCCAGLVCNASGTCGNLVPK